MSSGSGIEACVDIGRALSLPKLEPIRPMIRQVAKAYRCIPHTHDHAISAPLAAAAPMAAQLPAPVHVTVTSSPTLVAPLHSLGGASGHLASDSETIAFSWGDAMSGLI
eukprot:TRINITY_DN75458_c0_g1_i1.p1 TRINITY_DN75458_c0_g1~~TRINITY_DN75458_c0_g1_i1.p1  ORF type:complete len:109 (-),score=9.74 TRINITY_DN75458_c0_g1_i1:28-354(-)